MCCAGVGRKAGYVAVGESCEYGIDEVRPVHWALLVLERTDCREMHGEITERCDNAGKWGQ